MGLISVLKMKYKIYSEAYVVKNKNLPLATWVAPSDYLGGIVYGKG